MKIFRRLVCFPPKGNGDFFILAAMAAAAIAGLFLDWDPVRLQNMILLLAALIAVLSLRTARHSQQSARRTARQKATLVFLHEYDNSQTVRRGEEILNRRESNHAPFSEEDRVAVRDFLNHMELLAIGLKNGIYDESMICDAMETIIVRYYKRGEPFIQDARMRDGNAREIAYEHFEALALKILGQLKKPPSGPQSRE